ncbi:MAG: hypothetical protein P8Z38_01885 [Robiginitalea sp.]
MLSKFLFFLLFFVSVSGYGQAAVSLTDSLVADFHAAWNANDLHEMLTRLQEDAFFKSPHQLRVGRAELAKTVLKSNPPMIRDCRNLEYYSHVEGDIAWSVGRLFCNSYDESGNLTMKGEEKTTEYTYVFTRNPKGVWKIQMLLYHE